MTWDTVDITLPHAATDCNRLQQTATDCIVTTWVTLNRRFNVSQYPGATHCNTLQHTAYTLQLTANNMYIYSCIPPYIYICTLPTYIYRSMYDVDCNVHCSTLQHTPDPPDTPATSTTKTHSLKRDLIHSKKDLQKGPVKETYRRHLFCAIPERHIK